ncbi:hypothetical protein [Streptomyces sp. NPDC052114]|uniref:hypothetical protein n=1 Tax=unclassified Streptomyces TaxID=2593676 RepID=UPI00341900C2
MSAQTETEAERRARETYRVLLAHIEDCRACLAMEVCEEGTRIRRALRAARAAARTASDAS